MKLVVTLNKFPLTYRYFFAFCEFMTVLIQAERFHLESLHKGKESVFKLKADSLLACIRGAVLQEGDSGSVWLGRIHFFHVRLFADSYRRSGWRSV